MFKDYKLNPTEQIYLENLFKWSSIFKKEIKDFKAKYINKGIDYWLSFESAIDKYTKEEIIIYDNFFKDLKELASKFYILKYEKELPYYILWSWFSPLVRNKVWFDKNGIHLHFSPQVTKKEFLDSRDFVKCSKKMFNITFYKWKEKLRDKESEDINFDLKIILYKIKYEEYIPTDSEKTRISGIDNSQKLRHIKDMKKYIEALNKKDL